MPYIEYMEKTKTITLNQDQLTTILKGLELLKRFAGNFSKRIDDVLNFIDNTPFNQ